MWLLGVGVALLPFGYGLRGLFTKHTVFIGERGTNLQLNGTDAIALSIAYIAVGVFIHAHWFWGLHPKLEPFSPLLKLLGVLVFLGAFCYTMFRIMA